MNIPNKKILISENILQEIKIQKNDELNYFGSSKIYLGGKWVKKIAKHEMYAPADLFQYDLMSRNSEIFPRTIIKEIKGHIVVLQKKIDIKLAEQIYMDIDEFLINAEQKGFRRLLEDICYDGFEKNKTRYNLIMKKMASDNFPLLNWFLKFVKTVSELSGLFKQKPFKGRYAFDLHANNFGIENDRVKIIDFIAPR